MDKNCRSVRALDSTLRSPRRSPIPPPVKRPSAAFPSFLRSSPPITSDCSRLSYLTRELGRLSLIGTAQAIRIWFLVFCLNERALTFHSHFQSDRHGLCYRPVLGLPRITLLSPTKGHPRVTQHRTVGPFGRIAVVRRNNVQRTSIPIVEEKRRLASVSQARTRYGPGASEPLNTVS